MVARIQLARRITETKVVVDVAEVNELASIRQDGYWANPKWSNTPEAPRHTLSRVYDALVHAAELFAFRRDYLQRFRLSERGEILDRLRNQTLSSGPAL